jgi:hypothetical protein
MYSFFPKVCGTRQLFIKWVANVGMVWYNSYRQPKEVVAIKERGIQMETVFVVAYLVVSVVVVASGVSRDFANSKKHK